MKVWILLPAYNEARNLPFLLEDLGEVLGSIGVQYRVLVVDDGSLDGTRESATTFATRLPVELVVHDRNLGLARAIETGLRTLVRRVEPEDVVVTMDADNSHPPNLIPQMLAVLGHGADVVIASRYSPGGAESGVPFLRRVLSAGIALLLRLRFGMAGVRDYTSGYRAYRAALLQGAAARYGDRLVETRGFAVMSEVLVKLRPLQPLVVEVPLRLRYDRKLGTSKMRLAHTIRDYLSLLYSRPA